MNVKLISVELLQMVVAEMLQKTPSFWKEKASNDCGTRVIESEMQLFFLNQII